MWGVEYGNHKDAAACTKGRFRRVWRIWAALWSGLLLALAHVPSAYAEGEYQPSLAGVVQGPTPYASYGDDEYYDGYLVYGANKYDCLLYALGLNPNDFDLVARSKLDNPSKGGKFYEVVQEGYNTHCPAWVSVPFYEGWLYQSGTTPGSGQNPQYLWAFEIYKDDYERAKEDAEIIRDGGSVGGGGGDETGPEIEQDDKYVYLDTNPNDIDMPSSVTSTYAGIAFSISSYNKIKEILDEDDTYSLWIAINNNGQYTVGVVNSEPRYFVTVNSQWGCWYWNQGKAKVVYNASGSSNVTHNDKLYKVCNTIPNSNIYNPAVNCNTTILQGVRPTTSYYWGAASGDGGGEDEPDEPSPDPWPEPETPTPKPTNPTVPEPPDPQTPSDPVVPDPPTSPTPIGPNYPDEPPVTLPTIDDDNDFTVDLSGILDAMNEHCIHLQTCMISCTEYMKDVLVDQTYSLSVFLYQLLGSELYTLRTHNSNLAEYIVDNLLQGLHDGLVAVTDNQADLLDYFEEFAEWLDGKLDFKFPDSYDDTSVIYWLKRLYYKNGTGTVSRPEDPVTDPFGIGEWLRNLANLLIQALEGLAPGLVGDLLSTIDLLKLKFPFSLPWDMMAILGAFVASPEAPSIEFPCYAYTASGLEQVGTYDVDMDAYSAVMEGVRFVGYLGFMAYTLTLMPKWAETMCEVVGCA